MIFSMTGFATAATELDTGSLAVELRAVNHRYLDLQIRMPDELRMLEPLLREILAAQLTRGKVECRIGFAPRPSVQNPAQLNQPLVQQLAQWNDEVQAILPEADGLSVADVLRWNGVLQSASIPDTLQTMVPELLHQVLSEFTAARGREGEKLQDFLLQRIEQVETLCTLVSPRIPTAIAAYEEKLAARLRVALQTGDDERVRQEITLFASKIDVDEELSRLQTHLVEMKRVLVKGGTVGKRLDFLMQELHREANTLGSKSVDAEVSRASMEMKLLIEQMREQIQNLE
ncbi:MAG: YicC/YloC family endoribonuclease [Candidatus Nitrotoga sp.]|nr:YicC/YloC family endoribonuclease [Candidatus Nitrotoga sp.]MDO9447829.1 YicC/YloC family endoribonuclease [Candidatus Nitrotoga sp.]MDP3496706.1 YicC/YloC family endoribonuclease [Candidatus Nitrotoga sp.]